MNTAISHKPRQQTRLGRSIGAILAGAAVAIALTLASDLGMQFARLFPASGPPSGRMLLVATAYRTLYGVIAGYVVARLAPYQPMHHALIGGAVGLLVCAFGATATWNSGLGPHWYPLALIALSIPQAWAGGRVRLAQQRRGE